MSSSSPSSSSKSFFAVDPHYVDGTELSLVPSSPPPSSTTSIVIWRLVATANGTPPRGLYLPIDSALLVNSFSVLFPQLSSSHSTGPDLATIETCMANPDTFTLFLATETLETITLRQLPQQQQQQQQLEPQGADVSLEGNASSSSSLSTASTATLAGVPKITFKITKIVGCLTLITLTLLMNARAHIEDLVVADTCRGQGVGRGLMQRAINHAVLHRRCKMVDLTSKPDRIEARALYESLGFQIRNTGAFRYYAPSP